MLTIDKYLEKGVSGFITCFWTSYSIDYFVAHFMVKQHINPLLNGGECHFLVDINKAGERLNELSQLEAYSRLQKLSFVSVSKVEGAFHPKIMLLVGENEIRLLLTSANITKDGILANVDVIAKYEWVSNQKKADATSVDIITGAFQFLRQMTGWNEDAQLNFARALELHPWLENVKSNNFIYTSGEHSLLEMICKDIGSKAFDKIEVYSPFYDPDLYALKCIKNRFKKANIVAFAGCEPIELTSNNVLNELDEMGIQLVSGSALKKQRFHAKLFRFIDDNESIVYWGSANCSRAALTMKNYNSEFLVKSIITNNEFDQFISRNDNVELPHVGIKLKDSVAVTKRQNIIFIHEGFINEDKLFFKLKGFRDKMLIKVIGINGEKIIKNWESNSHINIIKLSVLEIWPLVLVAVDENEIPISNYLPIQWPTKVLKRADADSSSDDIKKSVMDMNDDSLRKIERCFIYEAQKPERPDDIFGGKQNDPNYWRSSGGIQKMHWGAGYSLRSIDSDLRNNDITDEDTPEEVENKVQKISRIRNNINAQIPVFIKVGKVAKKHYSRLKKNLKNGIKPVYWKWAEGLEHSIQYIIRDFANNDYHLNADDITDLKETLRYLSLLSLHCLEILFSQDKNIEEESMLASVLSYRKAIDLFYILSSYGLNDYKRKNIFFKYEGDYKILEDDLLTAKFNKIVFNVFNPINVQKLWGEHQKDLFCVINALNYSDISYNSLKEANLLNGELPELFDPKNIVEGGVYKHPNPNFGHCCIIKKFPNGKIKIKLSLNNEIRLIIKQ